MNRLQRIIQAASFLFFVILLSLAAHPAREGIPTDLFLRLDPSIGILSSIAERSWITTALLPTGVILLLTVFFGRFFCGYMCPMGTMIDWASFLLPKKSRKQLNANTIDQGAALRKYKYLFFGFLAAAAICGVSLVFLGSPISIATRLVALVFHPLLLLLADTGLELSGPIQSLFPQLAYMQVQTRVFATNEFIVLLALAIFGLSILQSRFWCRYLCPAGAIFAIFSIRPLIRRNVGDSCVHCNKCVRKCPMGCITQDQVKNVNPECISCLKCSKVCPVSAVSFGLPQRSAKINVPDDQALPYPTRRQTLAGLFSGFAMAGIVRTGWNQPRLMGQEKALTDAELIRPPGAIPEREFLARCVRCGQCMKACPTNTLQPVWFKAGIEGMFSPVLVPRLAACELNCATCGQVCPTAAIRPLDVLEKKSVKIGTAWIDRQACLVWNQDRKCLVCDEVCPYNAVVFKPTEGRKNAVPHVVPNKCTGCGWCENKCPVIGASAIRINIIGEVRLSSGSYIEKAQEYGLEFKTDKGETDVLAPETFEDYIPAQKPDPISGQSPATKKEQLPPGFIED